MNCSLSRPFKPLSQLLSLSLHTIEKGVEHRNVWYLLILFNFITIIEQPGFLSSPLNQMLLLGTHREFVRFSQCLSQALRSQIRHLFILFEKLARTTEQISFLVKCRNSGILPKTIDLLHLPTFMWPSTIRRIKSMVLRNAIRYLHREKHEIKKKCGNEITSLFTDQDDFMAFRISAACERAYVRSEKHHRERLLIKFNRLLGPEPVSVPPSDTNPELLVTDFSGSLSQEEKELLAKGPKFAIKKKWNEQMRLEVQSSFCKMAYQLRWQSQMEPKDAAHDPIPRYPESSMIHLPSREDQALEHKLKLTN